MKKVIWIFGLTLFTCSVGLLLWHETPPAEPTYKGKSCRYWLEQLASTPANKDNPEALEAISHIGTNALPTMVKMLATKDSRLKQLAMSLLGKQTFIKIGFRNVRLTREYASFAFFLFGSNARPAVPALIKLLSDDDPNVRYRAVEALQCIGPSASNAVPTLVALLNSDDKYFSEKVHKALAAIETNATDLHDQK